MADISEININDIPYSIKDTQARNTINSISTNLENYLPLSGGSLTGGLTTSLQTVVKDNTIDTTLSPESNLWPKHFVIKDKDDIDRGYFELYQRPDTTQGIQMETKRIVNNESLYNGIRLGIKEDGERTIVVTEKAPWRNALGASDGVWPISLGGTGATSVTSSTGAVHSLFPTNLGTTIEFLTGLTSGYATTGYTKLPLALELGGSGQDSVTKTTGSRNTDNTTAGTINIYKWGKVITVYSYNTIKLASSLASHKSVPIGSIGSAYRPTIIAQAWAGNASYPGVIYIGVTTGTITLYNTGSASIPADSIIHFTATYIIN